MLRSRAKQIQNAKRKASSPSAEDSSATDSKKVDKTPQLHDFISKRDYTGGTVLLEFQRDTASANQNTLPWLGYCAFHLGDFPKALVVYEELLESPDANPVYHLYKACCLFYLARYEDAEEAALQGPAERLQTRLLFHITHKRQDESGLMKFHQKLTESTEDQLSLAAIHYLRSHFQDATDVYKRLLIEYRDYLALQVYVAMCYYKLDYHDVSLEILGAYLAKHPDSAVAINLKACNQFKIYDGKAGEQELKVIIDMMSTSAQNFENDLIRHNLVVFRNGENALQVLPQLVEVVPEARLNLVIFHLKNDDIVEAYNLIKDIEPQTPQEYILKGVVTASIAQANDSREHLKLAQQFFQLVGASASECDTIPGRQCMASCFFLLKQFDDVLIYLESIGSYLAGDDRFYWNFGVALGAVGRYADAEEQFLQVVSESVRLEYTYLSWLARCYIMNGRPWEAWELYLKMETSHDSFNLLILIANEAYKVGSFYYAAKAFDVLERLDPTPEYWDGKRGACCGVLQMVIAGKEQKEHLTDVISMLRNNENSPQAEFIIRVMRKWANENGVDAAL